MKKYTLILFVASIAVAFIACKEKDHGDNRYFPPVNEDTAFTERIEFTSLDSLIITGDQYHISKDSAVIVLCHQAGWSRGEYKEIAPKLNAMGYNCIAIDQRSGNSINGITNETNVRAKAANKGTEYIDAKQDIIAAVTWAKSYYGKEVILWGSSYSSALSLIIAKENEDVKTVLAFSPGEYLGAAGVNVAKSIDGLNKPAFLTSSKSEDAQTKALYDKIIASNKVQFIPNGNGEHGSRALWEEKADYQEYWTALNAFLNSL